MHTPPSKHIFGLGSEIYLLNKVEIYRIGFVTIPATKQVRASENQQRLHPKETRPTRKNKVQVILMLASAVRY